jgi:septum formation protein
MPPKLYLASSSPRRKELLAQIGLVPEIVIAPIEEVALPNESPESFVVRMAVEKAMAGYDKLSGDDIFVIAGDTVVTLGDKVFGKPKHQQDAFKMLSYLSGKTHRVISAVSIMHDGMVLFDKSETKVSFKSLSEQEIIAYWQTNEPKGKAGSYAIQGVGAKFISRIEGSYSGVMGLPLFELSALLSKGGFYEE